MLRAHLSGSENALVRVLRIAGSNEDGQKVEREALLDTDGLVSTRSNNDNTVVAEPVRNNNHRDLGIEACSMWPSEVQLPVPADWKLGDKVPAQGPHGRIFFELPEGCVPGSVMRYLLRPEPEMRVEVPPGAKGGTSLIFERPDGSRISIAVPQGKKPGEHFDVVPPAVMVLVPEEAQTGDRVVFCLPGSNQWFCAPVPENLQLGKYFAARLPPPDSLTGQSPKAGSQLELSQLRTDTAAKDTDEEQGQGLE